MLQILNDVFASIDLRMKAAVRNETEEERALRMTEFLLMLKCKYVPTYEDELHEWMKKFGQGKREVVYPLLHWCLSVRERLCKRAYLAPFLTPVELPLELTMREDTTLKDLLSQYSDLQEDFKEVHKTYEALKKETKEIPGLEIRGEIAQLGDERGQLKDSISVLQNCAYEEVTEIDFQRILEATSAMRKEQDEEIRLQEKLREQTHSLSLSEQRLDQVQHRMRALISISSDGNSAEDILNEINDEVHEVTMATLSAASDKKKLESKLMQLEQERLEPTITEDDIESMRGTVTDLQGELDSVEKQISLAERDGNKVTIFKQVRPFLSVAPTKPAMALFLTFQCSDILSARKHSYNQAEGKGCRAGVERSRTRNSQVHPERF